ncbi:acyltransferase family protein [Catenovulum sp. 2E275]|uniref:acyltransferase family protein n=1 Tax=Catenovulum sp. 2E275 TaxID=2980497 RepID=UPI0021CF6A8B|nr:acyltransferase family protein [Catenovulum sp. 2E275]MCU4675556.1 acyltransferase family protein [Catenovulum sp. 2E275]
MERIPYLEPMRATLMLLGIFLHSAQVYNPAKSWLVSAPQSLDIPILLSEFIHIFRMPAFFILSGYLFYISINKYPFKVFIRKRLARVLIPLIVVATTINYVQFIFINPYSWESATYKQYWVEGNWVSHLWFLINLSIYFIVFAAFFYYINKKHIKFNIVFPRLNLYIWLCLLPISNLGLLFLNKLGFPIYSQFFGISSFMIIEYLPYFIFGLLMAQKKYIYQTYIKINIKFGLIFLMLLSAVYFTIVAYMPKMFVLDVIRLYLEYLATWLLSCLCFTSFSLLFAKVNLQWQFLASSAYSVYLFHQLIIVILASFFIYLALPAWLGFFLLLTITGFIAVGLHWLLVSSNRVGQILLNGKI